MTAVSIAGAFLRRDWAINRSYRFSFVSRIIATVVQLSMFFFLGHFVDQARLHSAQVLAHGYFSFLIIGILLLRLLNIVLESFRLAVEKDLAAGTLEALLATPPSPAGLIVAGPAYDVVNSLLVQLLLYYGIAILFFGAYVKPSAIGLLAALVIVVAFLLIFAAVGIVAAGLTLFLKRGGAFFGIYLVNISTVLGAIYYPVDILPRPLQFLANLLPITWAADALRAALLDGDVLVSRLVPLIVAACLAVPLSLWAFGLALDRARRDGSLTHY